MGQPQESSSTSHLSTILQHKTQQANMRVSVTLVIVAVVLGLANSLPGAHFGGGGGTGGHGGGGGAVGGGSSTGGAYGGGASGGGSGGGRVVKAELVGYRANVPESQGGSPGRSRIVKAQLVGKCLGYPGCNGGR